MIYSTKSYRHSISILTGKKKSRYYGGIQKTIEDFLNDNFFDNIWEMNYHLRNIDQLKLSKIRLANKTMSKGKSGGFRLILVLNKANEDIYLLMVYPKIGPEKKGNINDQEEEKLLKGLFSELIDDTLEKFVIK